MCLFWAIQKSFLCEQRNKQNDNRQSSEKTISSQTINGMLLLLYDGKCQSCDGPVLERQILGSPVHMYLRDVSSLPLLVGFTLSLLAKQDNHI